VPKAAGAPDACRRSTHQYDNIDVMKTGGCINENREAIATQTRRCDPNPDVTGDKRCRLGFLNQSKLSPKALQQLSNFWTVYQQYIAYMETVVRTQIAHAKKCKKCLVEGRTFAGRA
jgi:hypothetical protein